MHSPILNHMVILTCREENVFLDIQYNKHVHDISCMCDVYKC
jgi:hypothetical protein